jgi:hypothetical protein
VHFLSIFHLAKRIDVNPLFYVIVAAVPTAATAITALWIRAKASLHRREMPMRSASVEIGGERWDNLRLTDAEASRLAATLTDIIDHSVGKDQKERCTNEE